MAVKAEYIVGSIEGLKAYENVPVGTLHINSARLPRGLSDLDLRVTKIVVPSSWSSDEVASLLPILEKFETSKLEGPKYFHEAILDCIECNRIFAHSGMTLVFDPPEKLRFSNEIFSADRTKELKKDLTDRNISKCTLSKCEFESIDELQSLLEVPTQLKLKKLSDEAYRFSKVFIQFHGIKASFEDEKRTIYLNRV